VVERLRALQEQTSPDAQASPVEAGATRKGVIA
jgi:hypothetical protein